MSDLVELDEYDVRRELNRKVIEALDNIVWGQESGSMSDDEASAAVFALITATRGLILASTSALLDIFVTSLPEAVRQETWLVKGDSFICIASDSVSGELLVREGEFAITRRINANPEAKGDGSAPQIAKKLTEVARKRGFTSLFN